MGTLPRSTCFAAGALTGVLFAGCSEAPTSVVPGSAILITLDTTRADALSCYGVAQGTTPFFDELAGEGVLYLNARASAPLTLPSHASMLTGLYPPRHGLRNNGIGALPGVAETLAERASAQQVQTGAFIAAVVLDDAFGLDQGFDHYDSPYRSFVDTDSDYAERPAAQVVDAALSWLAGLDPSRPYFLWVHLFDAHGPHEPGPGSPNGESAYLAEVSSMDAQVRRLAQGVRERRGALPLTLIVGDHGEALGEHDEPTHGTFCYDGTLRVPMILRYPDGHAAGERVSAPTSVVDVYPTLLEGMGLGPAPRADGADGVDGESLFRRDPAAERGVYFESYYGYYAYGWSPISGWVDSQGKYVHSSKPEFFAIAEDSAELHDVSAARGAQLEGYLASIRRLAQRPRLTPDEELVADPELAAQIRSLGYAGSTSTDSEVPDIVALDPDLPSPRESAAEHKSIMRAQHLINEGQDHAAAEALLRGLLEHNEHNFKALDELGRCLMLQERNDEAVEVLLRVLEGRPRWPATLVNVSICLTLEGRDDEALIYLGRALEVDPNDTKALTNLTLLLESLGRAQEAAPYRARFLELTGQELPRSESDLGSAVRLMNEGDLAQAIERLEALFERQPEDTLVLLNLQLAYLRNGEIDRAIELLVEARANKPLDHLVHLNLADAYRQKAQEGATPDAQQLELALESARRACELAPTDAQAHGLCADVLQALGRADEATEAYVRAAQLDSSSANWLGKAARGLSDGRRWAEAVPLLRRLDELQPESSRVLFLLGACLANSGDLEGAVAALERAARIAPDDESIRGVLVQVRNALATPAPADAEGAQGAQGAPGEQDG